MTANITIAGDYIKLDSLLKLANLVMSGGEAKLLIMERLVKVNGEVETAADGSSIPVTGWKWLNGARLSLSENRFQGAVLHQLQTFIMK